MDIRVTRLLPMLVMVVVSSVAPTRHALAGGRSIVLLQVPAAVGGWSAAERRAVAELASMGFDVEVVPIPITPSGAVGDAFSFSGDWATWAAEVSVRKDAIAVVSVTLGGTPQNQTVVASILDRVTGKTTTRRIGPVPGEPPADAESAALLAVELLYSSLLEIEVPHPSRGQVATPPVVKSLVREQRLAQPSPRFSGHLGTAVSVAAGETSAQPGLAGGFTYFGRPWLAVAADGRVGAIPATVRAADATARLVWASARLQVLAIAWPRQTVTFFAGVGAGWLLAWSRGSSAVDIPTRTSVGGSPFVAASVGTGVRLRPNLRLRIEVDQTFLTAPIVVRFGGVQTAHVGRPVWDGVVALEWLWR